VQLKRSHVFGRRRLRRTPQKLSKTPDVICVSINRRLREIPQPHVFGHTFRECTGAVLPWSHRDTFKRKGRAVFIHKHRNELPSACLTTKHSRPSTNTIVTKAASQSSTLRHGADDLELPHDLESHQSRAAISGDTLPTVHQSGPGVRNRRSISTTISESSPSYASASKETRCSSASGRKRANASASSAYPPREQP
jgi:hypothetical protein